MRVCLVAVMAVLFVLDADAAGAEQLLPRTVDWGAHMTVAPDGTASIVGRYSGDESRLAPELNLRRARPGAAFGAPVRLARQSRIDRAACAGVAGDGTGIVVLERARRPHPRRVRVRNFHAEGAAGPARTLSAPGGTARHVACAVADSGAAVVVWLQHEGGGRWHLEAAVRDPGKATFNPPVAISGHVKGGGTGAEVAVGDRGDVLVGWYDQDGREEKRPPALVVRPAGAAFGATRRLSSRFGGGRLHLAVGARGHGVMAYSAAENDHRVAVYRLEPGAPDAGNPQPLGQSPFEGRGGAIAVSLAPGGRLMLIWEQAPTSTADAEIAVFEAEPDAALRQVAVLGSDVSESGFTAAVGDDGRALVAWAEHTSDRGPGGTAQERPFAALRPSSGAPFAAQTVLGKPHLNTAPYAARLVPQGGALVLWGAFESGDFDRDAALRTSAVARVPATSARASSAGKRPDCRRTGRTVDANESARLFIRGISSDGIYYVCWESTGRIREVGPSEPGEGVYSPRLAGRHVAYQYISCDRFQSECEFSIQFMNARTGRSAGMSKSQLGSPTAFVALAGRHAAWIRRRGDGLDVHLMSGSVVKVLDSGPDIDPTSLGFGGRRIYWTRGGTAKSVPID
jgi:hypothetical protein